MRTNDPHKCRNPFLLVAELPRRQEREEGEGQRPTQRGLRVCKGLAFPRLRSSGGHFLSPFLPLSKGKLKRKSEISQHQQLGSSPKRKKKFKAQVLNPIHMHPAKLPQSTRFPLASPAEGDAIWKKSIRAHAPRCRRRLRRRRRSGRESGLQDALPQCTLVAATVQLG